MDVEAIPAEEKLKYSRYRELKNMNISSDFLKKFHKLIEGDEEFILHRHGNIEFSNDEQGEFLDVDGGMATYLITKASNIMPEMVDSLMHFFRYERWGLEAKHIELLRKPNLRFSDVKHIAEYLIVGKKDIMQEEGVYDINMAYEKKNAKNSVSKNEVEPEQEVIKRTIWATTNYSVPLVSEEEKEHYLEYIKSSARKRYQGDIMHDEMEGAFDISKAYAKKKRKQVKIDDEPLQEM